MEEKLIEDKIIERIKDKPKYNNLAIVTALLFMFICIFSSSFMMLLKHLYLPAFFYMFLGNLALFIIGFRVKGIRNNQIVFNTTIPTVIFIAALTGFVLSYRTLISEPEITHVLRHVRIIFAITVLSFSYLCGRFIGLQNEINSNVYVEEKDIEEIKEEEA